MSNQDTIPQTQLLSYISSATPNSKDKRAPWYKNTAPAYAGIFLWFVFWQEAVNSATTGGGLVAGLGVALLGLVAAALICHFLFYLVPGLLGMKTGLPLYIVGTSTFGAKGGFLMPGFLMGVLQFGWLGVNAFFSAQLLAPVIHVPAKVLMVVWAILAAFVGLKGIQYVARVATYLPLIPLVTLLILFVKTAGSIGSFDPEALGNLHAEVAQTGILTAAPAPAMSTLAVLAFIITTVVGFFATAGAAGVDFGLNSRNAKDVSRGGLFGIALAIILTAGLSACVVAGVYGNKEYSEKAVASAKQAVTEAVAQVDAVVDAAAKAGKPITEDQRERAKEEKAVAVAHNALYQTPNLMGVVLGDKLARILWFLLALAAFPPACFSAFIAANSFKTTLPQVNPFISVGIGAAISIVLAVTGLAGDASGVFKIIGASFGPICGAMFVDYWLNGKKWSGPRAGVNPAGWIAWAIGFIVGISTHPKIGAPDEITAPVAAFIVAAVVYYLCFKIGIRSAVVPVSGALAEAAK